VLLTLSIQRLFPSILSFDIFVSLGSEMTDMRGLIYVLALYNAPCNLRLEMLDLLSQISSGITDS
jgi:hypothetical protein